MTQLDTTKFGFPLRDGYGIKTSLALQRTTPVSGWTRQRRTFLHNASLVTLTWRLRASAAKELNDWLQAQPETDFFTCDLLSGNDVDAPCSIAPLDIRRVSGVSTSRIPLTDQFTLTFDAETRSQTGYQAYADAASDMPPTSYPSGLPLPQASGFGSVQGTRNISAYSLVYEMNTETLADFLAFAGFAGTAWFYHPMVSVTVTCGFELLRYTSELSQSLVGPDRWAVSVSAETMPSSALLRLGAPPIEGDCFYNSDIFYDDAEETYDCSGVTPPQGNFTMPAGLVTLTNSASGAAPQSTQVLLKINRDGTVVSTPASTPAWSTWHTAPLTLPMPAMAINQVVEISRNNGATWIFTTPQPGGTWLSLQGQDIWIRKVLTSTFDQSSSLDFTISFSADQVPTGTLFNSSSIRFSLAVDVTDTGGGGGGIVQGGVFADSNEFIGDPEDLLRVASAGVIFTNQGLVLSDTTNTAIGSWFTPTQINAGVGLFVQIDKTSGLSDISWQGTRRALSANQRIVVSKKVSGGGNAEASWVGTYGIYNAATGGVPLGSGTIDLYSYNGT